MLSNVARTSFSAARASASDLATAFACSRAVRWAWRALNAVFCAFLAAPEEGRDAKDDFLHSATISAGSTVKQIRNELCLDMLPASVALRLPTHSGRFHCRALTARCCGIRYEDLSLCRHSARAEFGHSNFFRVSNSSGDCPSCA